MYPFVNIHTHRIVSNEQAIVNLNYNDKPLDNILYSFGLHPWHIGNVNEQAIINKLESYCASRQIIAVGEIGLDRSISASLELQKHFFVKQLNIAKKYAMPVIIHGVRANADLLQILKEYGNSNSWILHGFKGSLQDANQFINKNCYISFGSNLLINSKLQILMQQIPIDRIFLETDDANTLILDIYNKAATILQVDESNLKQQVYSNFIQVFKSDGARVVK